MNTLNASGRTEEAVTPRAIVVVALRKTAFVDNERIYMYLV